MKNEVTANEQLISFDKNYKKFLVEIKKRVLSSRARAALAVNKELLLLYWYIGKQIIEKQQETNWGGKLFECLSKDLRNAFPETAGFSRTNLKYMRMFACSYPDLAIGQQPVDQFVLNLPWGHIVVLIQKVSDVTIRKWYAKKAIEGGWSRYVLEDYIKNDLYAAQAIPSNKASNYLDRLEPSSAKMAQELLKSPYNFDFLGLHDEAHERDIEHASIQHITKFMLELGRGFSFVGHQVPITINNNEFFIDMLFYNLKLRCFTVVEIKNTKFKPEHTGQLNFYLSAVDDMMRHSDDNPSVGILLCKSRDKVVAEYALKSIEKPIGVSEYQLTKALPEKLQNAMPTIQEIEAELNEG